MYYINVRKKTLLCRFFNPVQGWICKAEHRSPEKHQLVPSPPERLENSIFQNIKPWDQVGAPLTLFSTSTPEAGRRHQLARPTSPARLVASDRIQWEKGRPFLVHTKHASFIT